MSAARAFLTGILDYAGLFPPASLSMEEAVRAYASYKDGQDSAILSRFVIPAARLDEFSDVGAPVLPSGEGSFPWRLSVIAADAGESLAKALHFNCSHWGGSPLGHAVCDAVEIGAWTPDDIDSALAAFPAFFQLFIEIPSNEDPRPLIERLAGTRGAAKIRTGGIVENAIPASEDVLRFMRACARDGVRFKATAGLHHAVRGRYPLTYEPHAPSATMHGYINVFLAAAFLLAGMSDDDLIALLGESDGSTFHFGDAGASWRTHFAPAADLARAREQLALSFGSCSFTEPVTEARSLHFI